LEVYGPAVYMSDKNMLNTEAYISVDINEKASLFVGAGYSNYKYTQYNYEYLNKGEFIRAGVDFNMLKPDKSIGKYWAGVGLRYGASLFSSEIPSFKKENYFGITTSSIPKKTYLAHFLEVSPGVKAEVFRNFSMGWTISLRMLLYSGTGKDLRAIYLPGFGNGSKKVSTGINYFIVWNIPYKKINVILRPEVQEESPAEGGQQSTGIRP
jgi:hypothetical protein